LFDFLKIKKKEKKKRDNGALPHNNLQCICKMMDNNCNTKTTSLMVRGVLLFSE
jgi:hypothetical protein